MPYQAEFRFLQQVIAKLHLQSCILIPGELPTEAPDQGLRHFLGQSEEYIRFFLDFPQQIAPNTIYKITDAYLCNYLFLRLPSGVPSVLMIGPYLKDRFSFKGV